MENRQEIVREKGYYKDKIIGIVEKIENPAMLEYLYIFIQGKVEEVVRDEESE